MSSVAKNLWSSYFLRSEKQINLNSSLFTFHFSLFCCTFAAFLIMILELVLIIVGIAVVLWGADRFTEGACGLARRLNVSELVIGLTIVSLGTSLPEFIVSLMSVLRNSSDMSVGNILGSNIFNILVIIGASSIMRPIKVRDLQLRRHFAVCLSVSCLLWFFAYTGGTIQRLEGFALAVFFCVYIYRTYQIAAKDRKAAPSQEGENQKQEMSLSRITLFIIVGTVALVGGGRVLVENAAAFAREIGIRESVIGMTILAGGTSFPELATSVIAARKGSYGLSLGNAIGSNIFNVAFVIGTCGSFVQMPVTEITLIDWFVFVGSVMLTWLVASTGHKLDKKEGVLLVLCYLAYLTWLLLR